MNRLLPLILVLLFPLALTAASDVEAPLIPNAKIAYFGVHFIDTSTEGAYNGVRDDETQRTQMLEEAARQRMTDEGFVILDNAPIQTELDRIVDPGNCYGCDVRMAEKLGADYVLVGQVQKVSNLILSMNLVLRSVPDGKMVRGLAVDIRGNTDDSWMRGMNYILNNNFFKEQ